MDNYQAERQFGALTTASRLEILKLLATAGKEGMASGKVAETLGVVQNTLSTQLNLLASAALVEKRREGRHIFYSVNTRTIAGLIDFLAHDCAGGRIKLGRRRS